MVLLDLSTAFDTIDHDTLFVILEKYVGITGSALQLLKSYFQTDYSECLLMMSCRELPTLCMCGVPQGSVLGPLKCCLYLLPLGAILRYHSIDYHIYADDTQLYISFKCNTPLASLIKLSNCISDIRVWMINIKLKIIYSKNIIYSFSISTSKARFEWVIRYCR